MSPTALIRSHVLPRYRILLIYLVLQMLLLLRPHLQRTPQVEYCVLRGIFALRHPAAEALPQPQDDMLPTRLGVRDHQAFASSGRMGGRILLARSVTVQANEMGAAS